jgi:hypothetical protein
MMTSMIDNAIADRAHAAGVLAFLKKPFYPADIDRVLERYYGLHVSRGEHFPGRGAGRRRKCDQRKESRSPIVNRSIDTRCSGSTFSVLKGRVGGVIASAARPEFAVADTGAETWRRWPPLPR